MACPLNWAGEWLEESAYHTLRSGGIEDNKLVVPRSEVGWTKSGEVRSEEVKAKKLYDSYFVYDQSDEIGEFLRKHQTKQLEEVLARSNNSSPVISKTSPTRNTKTPDSSPEMSSTKARSVRSSDTNGSEVMKKKKKSSTKNGTPSYAAPIGHLRPETQVVKKGKKASTLRKPGNGYASIYDDEDEGEDEGDVISDGSPLSKNQAAILNFRNLISKTGGDEDSLFRLRSEINGAIRHLDSTQGSIGRNLGVEPFSTPSHSHSPQPERSYQYTPYVTRYSENQMTPVELHDTQSIQLTRAAMNSVTASMSRLLEDNEDTLSYDIPQSLPIDNPDNRSSPGQPSPVRPHQVQHNQGHSAQIHPTQVYTKGQSSPGHPAQLYPVADHPSSISYSSENHNPAKPIRDRPSVVTFALPSDDSELHEENVSTNEIENITRRDSEDDLAAITSDLNRVQSILQSIMPIEHTAHAKPSQNDHPMDPSRLPDSKYQQGHGFAAYQQMAGGYSRAPPGHTPMPYQHPPSSQRWYHQTYENQQRYHPAQDYSKPVSHSPPQYTKIQDHNQFSPRATDSVKHTTTHVDHDPFRLLKSDSVSELQNAFDLEMKRAAVIHSLQQQIAAEKHASAIASAAHQQALTEVVLAATAASDHRLAMLDNTDTVSDPNTESHSVHLPSISRSRKSKSPPKRLFETDDTKHKSSSHRSHRHKKYSENEYPSEESSSDVASSDGSMDDYDFNSNSSDESTDHKYSRQRSSRHRSSRHHNARHRANHRSQTSNSRTQSSRSQKTNSSDNAQSTEEQSVVQHIDVNTIVNSLIRTIRDDSSKANLQSDIAAHNITVSIFPDGHADVKLSEQHPKGYKNTQFVDVSNTPMTSSISVPSSPRFVIHCPSEPSALDNVISPNRRNRQLHVPRQNDENTFRPDTASQSALDGLEAARQTMDKAESCMSYKPDPPVAAPNNPVPVPPASGVAAPAVPLSVPSTDTSRQPMSDDHLAYLRVMEAMAIQERLEHATNRLLQLEAHRIASHRIAQQVAHYAAAQAAQHQSALAIQQESIEYEAVEELDDVEEVVEPPRRRKTVKKKSSASTEGQSSKTTSHNNSTSSRKAAIPPRKVHPSRVISDRVHVSIG